MCQFSYPEYNSSATLPFDTAKYLTSQGNQVDVMCGYPKEYNRAGKVPNRETVSGVNIHRLHYVQLKRVGKLGRLINYFSYTASALFHILEMRKYDAIICYSNPPVLPAVAMLASRLYGVKVIFVAYDVYPEVAYASGSLSKGSIVDKVMRWLNHITYKNAAAVVALTDEMKEFLLLNRPELDAERVFVIPNWAHESKCEATPSMYKRFGYQEEQFIVSYFGNMGICQEMNTLIETARQLRENEKVRFLIAGHGSKKEQIESYVHEHNLSNVQILDFLTGEEFEQALAISSCCVVSLEPGLKGMCAPSKYYSYLQSGHVVIAITERDCYLAKEVENEQIGCATEIGNVDGLCDWIVNIEKEPNLTGAMGEKAMKLYEQSYKKEIAMYKYLTLFQMVGVDT